MTSTLENVRLRQWAKTNGVSIEQVADRTGYNLATVANIVQGNHAITDRFRWRFQQAFGVAAAAQVFMEVEHAA